MGPIQTTALALCLAIAPIASFAQDRSAARIKDLALEVIRENPQIIMEAVQLLEEQQAAGSGHSASGCFGKPAPVA